ncbi:hypothetical protein TrRE_jg1614, partial [Triparma retinervis]
YRKASGQDVKVKRGALQNPLKLNKLANSRWLLSFPGLVNLEAMKKEEGKDGRMGRIGGLDTDAPWVVFDSGSGSIKFSGTKYWSTEQFVPIIAHKKGVKVDDAFTGIIVFDTVLVEGSEKVGEGGKTAYKPTGGSEGANPFKEEKGRREKKERK